jgi:hypothetical protein
MLDLYARDFVLVRLGPKAPEGSKIVEAAKSRGVPIKVERIDDSEAASIYDASLVLVRPDGHVAWRGNSIPNNPVEVIDRIRGA